MRIARKPKNLGSFSPIIGMAVIIVYSMLVLEVDPHIPIVISTILAGAMALKVGCSWLEIRNGMIESVYRAVEALIIVMIVGMLIGSWVLAGSVPSNDFLWIRMDFSKFFRLLGVFYVQCICCNWKCLTSGGTIGVVLWELEQVLELILQLQQEGYFWSIFWR